MGGSDRADQLRASANLLRPILDDDPTIFPTRDQPSRLLKRYGQVHATTVGAWHLFLTEEAHDSGRI
jgi:hypothetical protein